MGKQRSRVAQEAREAQQRAADVQRKIKELNEQISNPQKHFLPKADERTQSTVERFRRYFTVDRAAAIQRKPTRSEMRAQKNRAIFWAALAFIIIIYVSMKLLKLLKS
jgi:hypothetical protein